MKIYLSSNFNLLETNNTWNVLKKKNQLKFGEYNDIFQILQNRKLISDYELMVLIISINDFNTNQITELKKLTDINSKKFPNTNFFFKILNQNFNNFIIDKENSIKKNELLSFLLDKNKSNISVLSSSESDELFSIRNKFLLRCPLSLNGLSNISKEINQKVNIMSTKPFKLIILDCDNTLWGGVAGEDGIHKLKYGEDGEGKIFEEIQRYIKKLKTHGFVLSISSKNDEKTVWETLKKRNMILQKKDFLFSKINWFEKSYNIGKIINEMNIKQDDVLFIDDSKIEREKIKRKFKKINLIDSSDLSNYLMNLYNHPRLQKLIVLNEDKKKYNQYILKDKFEKKKSRSQTTNFKNFYRSLKQKIFFHKVNNSNILRTEQLFNKTNQFNLTTNRYTLKEIQDILIDKKKFLNIFSLKDKFGDHGIIGLVLYCVKKKKLIITDFILSCRIISRKIEEYIILKLLEKTKKNEIDLLHIPTEKNKMLIKKFLSENNFQKKNDKKLLKELSCKKNMMIFNLKMNNKLKVINEYFKK